MYQLLLIHKWRLKQMMDKNTNQKKVYAASKNFQVFDNDKNINFQVIVHYPTNEVSKDTDFGPYTIDVSIDAPISKDSYPLVIISHGSGGSLLLYHTISTFLAKNGFIVAMVEHFANNCLNNELENSEENLILRPKHVSLTIDKLINDINFSKSVDTNKIAVIGHSMGGYTALALAGGIPRTKEAKIIEVKSDPRVKAIVLLAPGVAWFFNGLDDVEIPILLMTGEKDNFLPTETVNRVMNGIIDKSKLIQREVPNAGHFSFLIPFPPEKANADFLPAIDPKGFDRKKFHELLPIEICDFLKKNLQ
jgi:predicted dienelactone hydrolase